MHDEAHDGETEPLRRVLRRYQVPGPPPEIEGALRARFREERRKRAVRSLAVAASLLLAILGPLLIAWVLRPAEPARTTAGTPTPAAGLAAASPPVETAAAAPAGVPAATPTPRRRRGARPAARQPEILVEPGQAELLRQFARGLRSAPWVRPSITGEQFAVDVPSVEDEPRVPAAVIERSGG